MSNGTYTFPSEGTCASEISFSIDSDAVHNVKFHGGCPGNAIGLSQLLEGMTIDDAMVRLKGIPCGKKATSCPDQFVKALEKIRAS